jgi:hypothetical protein
LDAHAVVDFVAFLEPTEDANCVFDGGFTDEDLLEPAF